MLPRRLMRWAPFAAMSLLTLVLAHNLVYVAGYGAAFRQVLWRTGHGPAWGMAVAIVVAVGLGVALAGALRLAELSREARDLGVPAMPHVDGHVFVRGLLRLWLALLAVGTALYVIQENVEALSRAGTGATLPGLAVVAPTDRADAIVALAAVAAFVAFVGHLFRWQHDVLVAGIAKARRTLPRAHTILRRPHQRSSERPASAVAAALAIRAPPIG